ncbi:hypothetical protein [Parasphaerochaeta coccoides]|uniref:hypothetical protein n=1 Tax=Parasphaerochaeta coccoides TaxID=273376 RepID=UPI0003200728|nr:hypothetical protein [Parasphaerochaeta coccoides]
MPEKIRRELQSVRRVLWRMTGDVAFYAASSALTLAHSRDPLSLPEDIPWDGSRVEISSRAVLSDLGALILPAVQSPALERLTYTLTTSSGASAAHPQGLMLAPMAKESFLYHQQEIEDYLSPLSFSPITDARLAVLELEQSLGGWHWQFFQPKRLAWR